MESYARWILAHKRLVVFLVALITGLAIASASQAVVHTSIKKIFFGDSPAFQQYKDRINEFSNDEMLFIGVDGAQPFTDGPRFDSVAERALEEQDIASVFSVHDAQQVLGGPAGLKVRPYGTALDPPEVTDQRLLEQIRADPLNRSFVSAEGDASLVLVEMSIAPERRGEDRIASITRVIEDYQSTFGTERIHPTGLPALLTALLQSSIDNLVRLFPITIVALLGAVWFLFRRFMPVLVTGGVAAIAVVWTLGFAALLDREFNLFTTMVPAVILIVGFSDTIHLWSAYLSELRHGKNKEEAILASATDVGTACLFTSMTTFAGFVSLSLIPTPVFRVLGVVLGFGVAIALLLAMTLVPIACAWLPEPDAKEQTVAPLVDRLVQWCASFSTRFPKGVVAAYALVLAGCVFSLQGLNIDADFQERMAPDHPYRVHNDWVVDRFTGTNTLEVFVDAGTQDGVLEQFQNLAAFEAAIEALPEVDEVLSLVDVLAQVHPTLGGEGRIPATRAAVAQELLLFEMSGGDDLDRFVDFDRQRTRLSARLNINAVRATNLVDHQVEALGRELFPTAVGVHAESMVSLFGAWLDEIFEGQKRGMTVSFLAVTVMMVIGLKRLVPGLLSMIPNALPLVVLGGTFAALFDPVDSDAFLIAIMAVGIGVDDTIHFLMRYRIEAERADVNEALRRTFSFAGRAIVMTTIILGIGFLPYGLSDYWSIWAIGLFIPFTLVHALAADLLLVPAMVRLGWIRFPRLIDDWDEDQTGTIHLSG